MAEFPGNAGGEAGAAIAPVGSLLLRLGIQGLGNISLDRKRASVHQIIEFDAETRAPFFAKPAGGDERQIGGGKLVRSPKITGRALTMTSENAVGFSTSDIGPGHRGSAANHELRTDRS